MMDLRDIIMLSLCSKKCASLLRTIRNLPNKMDILIGSFRNSVILYEDRDKAENCIQWCFEPYLGRGMDTMWRVNGITFHIVQPILPTDDSSIMTECPWDNDLAVNFIISHFLHVIPRCHVENLHILILRETRKFRIRRALSSVSEVNHLNMEGRAAQKDFKFVFNNLKIKNSLRKDYHEMDSYQSVRSLNCKDRIMSYCSTWAHPDILLNLNCKHSTFLGTQFKAENILEFLKKWKTSEGNEMRNIESLKIEIMEFLESFENVIWIEMDAKACVPRELDRRIKKFPDVDFEYGMDIKRTDGLQATVMLDREEKIFEFYVWHDDEG
ncbi:hypothetical protein CRE_02865 [Caenorhabditis remanei]|uniref:Sdz-33 F-box domain-containing protein n=1 Tax=Caenorhabditis remanei TaxID=31234 RepID=E3LWB5_CAERE|nr:hypothetical protein CRE_02865 [Caenorhabditis remanei]